MGIIMPFLVVIIILGGITYILYRRRSRETSETIIRGSNSFDKLCKTVQKEYTEVTKLDRGLLYKDVDYEASRKNKERAAESLKKCVTGDENSKRVVMSLTRDIISKHVETVMEAYEIIDFSSLYNLTPEQKFEILLYEVRKEYKKEAIKYLSKTYKWSDPRIIREGMPVRREVDANLIDQMFEDLIPYDSLDYQQCLDILAILVYQSVKGYGKIETLREMNIDGLELGTIGAIRYRTLGVENPDYVIERSCSIQLDAQWIHLSFIDFGSVDEIKRLTINMTNVEGSEALTNKHPLKVVDSYNGDRITAIRPDVGATWGLFVRSFSAGITRIKDWLNRPEIHNWEIVDQLLYYLAQSTQNVFFTGQQNTGKTTMMKGYIEYFPYFNIRVLEMSFELALNEIYNDRNIFCTKPNEYVTSTMVQDILKKTDGYLSMVGEIAEAVVAANAMRFGLVASAATIASHHGRDYRGLVDGLTGDLISSGYYTDFGIAQGIVLDVVKHNVHLDFEGKLRIVEYIEEIVKGETLVQYPDVKKSIDLVDAMDQMTAMNREYYQRTTDRVLYSRREIIRFNRNTLTYEPNEWYTKERFEAICKRLPADEVVGFIEFYEKNWGKRLREKAAKQKGKVV